MSRAWRASGLIGLAIVGIVLVASAGVWRLAASGQVCVIGADTDREPVPLSADGRVDLPDRLPGGEAAAKTQDRYERLERKLETIETKVDALERRRQSEERSER